MFGDKMRATGQEGQCQGVLAVGCSHWPGIGWSGGSRVNYSTWTECSG